jgi:hypothetical protein
VANTINEGRNGSHAGNCGASMRAIIAPKSTVNAMRNKIASS